MADNGPQSSYACKCLNVRIRAQAPPGPPQEPLDGAYTPVYVGEDGVSVAHIQLTLRNKGPRTERKTGEKTEAVRVVSLTCLVCESLVYRISQAILPDVESGEGLVLPTDEWVENEVLKSADGWIEVSQEAMVGKAIEEAEASPEYSKIFGLLLPSGDFISNKEAHAFLSPPQSARPSSPEIPETLLPHLPDLIPPPPFTPTHPVFTHLAACATAESERLRAEGDAHMKRELQKTITAIQAEEALLKQSVERLWARFKGVVQKFEEEDTAAPPRIRLKTRRSSSRGRGTAASVRVTDFVPTPSPPPRQSRLSAPAPSALSASLATSNLQGAMAHRQRELSPPKSTSSKSPTRVPRTNSPSTASSKTLGIPISGEAEIREAHRRNMDESLDVATSFKYMMDLAQHVEVRPPPSVAEEPEEEDSNVEVPSPSTSTVPRGRSPRAGKSAIKKPKTNGDVVATKEPGSPVPEHSPPKEQTTPTKGKRKVTFDVKPDVVTIADASPQSPPPQADRPEEEVFDMEGETIDAETDTADAVAPAPPQPELPVQEPIRLARRPHRFRHTSHSGLPSSLSSLRPASLPAPSMMRRVVSLDKPADDRNRTQNIRDSVLSPTADGDVKRRDVTEEVRELQEEDEPADPREAEILRLVAASMPSHRSAWRKDSSAWRTFVNRQKHDGKHKAIPEEDESSATDSSAADRAAYYDESTDSSNPDDEARVDNWSGGTVIAKSLPIPIGPLGRPPFLKTSNPAGSLNKMSTEAMRRASYRERDRMRSIDPGALDFDFEDDVEDELAPLPEKDEQAVGKSMQRALNILQKQSEIPGAGMWRSLA